MAAFITKMPLKLNKELSKFGTDCSLMKTEYLWKKGLKESDKTCGRKSDPRLREFFFLLLLTTSASTCSKNSHNLVPTFLARPLCATYYLMQLVQWKTTSQLRTCGLLLWQHRIWTLGLAHPTPVSPFMRVRERSELAAAPLWVMWVSPD